MEKLQSHLQSISDIFVQQKQQLGAELAEKDRLLSESTNRIMALEHDNQHLRSTISELERKLLLSENESRTTLQSYHSLSVRYQNLKNAASQLEAFRKSMISIVQNSSFPQDQVFPDLDESSDTLGHPSQGTFEKSLNGNDMRKSQSTLIGSVKRATEFYRSSSDAVLKKASLPELPKSNSSPRSIYNELPMTSRSKYSPQLSSDDTFNHVSETKRSELPVTSRSKYSPQLSSDDTFNHVNETKRSISPQMSPHDLGASKELDTSMMDESLIVNERFPGDQSHFLELSLPEETQVPKATSLSSSYTERFLNQMNQSSDSIKEMVEKTKQLESKTAIDAATLYRTIKQRVSKESFHTFAATITAFNAGNKTPMQTIEEIRSLIQDDELTLQMSRLICNAYQ